MIPQEMSIAILGNGASFLRVYLSAYFERMAEEVSA